MTKPILFCRFCGNHKAKNKQMCAACFAARKEAEGQKSKERHATKYQVRKSKGLCVNCGVPNPRAPRYARCPRCAEQGRRNTRKWGDKNHELMREYARRSRKKNYLIYRQEVIAHYGGKCACCGESEMRFLTLDHSLGDGKQHRELILGNGRLAGSNFTMKLKALGFPDVPGLQVLCYNCHNAKDNWGECPHKSKAILAGEVGFEETIGKNG